MKIVTRFLMRRFFGGVFTVLATVCGIIFAVTFVERLPSNPGAISAMRESFVRLLEYMPLFLPLAVFMGTLLAAYNLTKSSENIIISGAGISPYQGAKPFLIGAAIMGIIVTTVVNPYSVRLSSGMITADNFNLTDRAIWLREGSDNGVITMRAENVRMADDNIVFQNATVFVQTTDFKLTERIRAPELTLSESGLDTAGATIWNARGAPHHGVWHGATKLTPQTVLDRYLQPDQISFWRLPTFIQKMQSIGVAPRGHWVQFWTLLFLPLTLIAMTILGVAFSQTRQRRNFNFIAKFAIGIITCFALYFLTNLFAALGASGALPALLAILAPTLIIISIAGIMIASFDVT